MPHETFFLFFSGAVLELSIRSGCPLGFLAAYRIGWLARRWKTKRKVVWFAAIYRQTTPTGFEPWPEQRSLC